MSEIALVLKRAKELLEQEGWTQRYYHDAYGARCAVGALRDSAFGVTEGKPWNDGFDLFKKSEVAVCRVIGGNVEYPGDAITQYNDAPERTQEEVLNMFDAAVALEES